MTRLIEPGLLDAEESLLSHAVGEESEQTIRLDGPPKVSTPDSLGSFDVTTKVRPGYSFSMDADFSSQGKGEGPSTGLTPDGVTYQIASDPSILEYCVESQHGSQDPGPGVAPLIPPSSGSSAEDTAQSGGEKLLVEDALLDLERPQLERYHLLAMLGKGGQGEVFEAWQEDLQRAVAVKISSNVSASLRDFLGESLTVARLDHPNVVPIHGIGLFRTSTRTLPVLVMKRIAGDSWRTLLHRDRKDSTLSTEQFLTRHLEILIQVLNALSYAHDHGIIHRDLKPAQVMVGNYGEVYLGDWGLAVRVEDRELHAPTHLPDALPLAQILAEAADIKQDTDWRLGVPVRGTATNPAGTPAYMAPEQVSSDSTDLCYGTDIYLVGAILYELVCGYPPHRAPNLRDVVRQALLNEFSPLPVSAPQDLAELILRCLATNPADRPASVREISTVLRNYLTGSQRKTEGRRLIQQVDEAMDHAQTYEELSELATIMGRAASYYPDFHQLPVLRDAFLARYARVALELGDLVVARVQVNRIQDAETRELLSQDLVQATAKLEKSLERPPLLNWPRGLFLIAALVLVFLLRAGLMHKFSQSLEEEALARAGSVADMVARGLRQSDLDSVVKERRINSPEFQRSLNALLPFRRAQSDIRRISTFQPMIGGTWTVAVDTAPLDLDRDMDGNVSAEEKGRPPGRSGFQLPSEAMEALRAREQRSVMLSDTDGDSLTWGFAPVLDTGSAVPVSLVAVEIPTVRISEARRQMGLVSLVATLILGAMVTGTLLAIYHSRRSLEIVHRLRQQLEQQENTLNNKTINLG